MEDVTGRMRGRICPAVMGLGMVLAATTPSRAADAVFREADGMVFSVHDIAVYDKHRAELDLFGARVGMAGKSLKAWFGPHLPAPLKLLVKNGSCAVGINAGVITVGDTCLVNKTTPESQSWARYAVFFFMGYALTGPVSGGWPYEAWSDPFNKVISADLAGELDGSAAKAKVEAEVDTDAKKRKYQFYRALRDAHGFPVYQEMWNLMKSEGIDLAKVGPDGNGIRNSYIIAYLSLAVQLKIGRAAAAAGIPEVSGTTVMDVLRARNLILIADRKGKNTASAWAAFRAGRPQEVKGLLP